MLLPCDPLIVTVFGIGLVIYFGLKSLGEKLNRKDDDVSVDDLMRRLGESTGEYKRYQKRLEEHNKD